MEQCRHSHGHLHLCALTAPRSVSGVAPGGRPEGAQGLARSSKSQRVRDTETLLKKSNSPGALLTSLSLRHPAEPEAGGSVLETCS